MKFNLNKQALLAVLMFAVFVVLIALFLYLDRRNQISGMIQNMGFFGVFVSILLVALVCMTPIPSEGILVMMQKIYGVYCGTFIAWLGSIVSSLVIFALARNYGQRFIRRVISPANFAVVEDWIKSKGTSGLFIARLLPLPAFAVNYVAGVIPAVRFWPYVWTAAVSIIPYYVGTALVFLGASQRIWSWLAVGSVIVIAIWILGYRFNRHK